MAALLSSTISLRYARFVSVCANSNCIGVLRHTTILTSILRWNTAASALTAQRCSSSTSDWRPPRPIQQAVILRSKHWDVRRAQGAALRGRLVPGPRGPDGHTTWSAGPVQRRRAIETGDLLLSLDAAPK